MTKVSDKNSLRILQIGMHDQLGGVEVFLMNYYKNIDRNKIQFDFINHCESLCFSDEIQSLGGRIFNVPSFKKNVFKYYSEIKKIIKENKYEIVHINLLSCSNILPIIAAKRSKAKKIIVHSHNNGMPDSILKTILHFINKKIINRIADVFWACSSSAGEWMFGNSNFQIIKNGVNIDNFIFDNKNRDNIRKKFNISNDKYLIGHVGRFDIQKNHEYLIQLFSKINKKYKDTMLMLIGTGVLYDDIVKQVKSLKLEGKVIFTGVVNDPQKYYSAMDLFLLPSKFEGLGIVNVEAQACGLPCIVSDVVPKEVKITDNFRFVNLNKEELWLKEFSKFKNSSINRKIKKESMKSYDISFLAKEIEIKYINLL